MRAFLRVAVALALEGGGCRNLAKQGSSEPQSPATTSRSFAARCPTGEDCGAGAPYCANYSAPSTKGAKLISALPFRIVSSGTYYLNTDLTSAGTGIAVLADNVQINLHGHTIVYGAMAPGRGASSVGEYGIIACNTQNLVSEELDLSFAANGFCRQGGISARNLAIENGKIVQSPNASQYYDPMNCPGSGVSPGCAHHHESSASDVINVQYATGLRVTHMTLEWQNTDSDGIHMAWQQSGAGHLIECNTFNDRVTEINNRAYQRGIPINGQNARQADHPDSIRYNTLIGSPQAGILSQAAGTHIEYNDINLGYYQFPPFTNQGRTYSNDYGIGACAKGGTIAYNYVHSVSGRGIGCLFGGDMGGMKVHDNYIDTIEQDSDGEYGPNGTKPGARWVGGCEINGGRGFESKESPNIAIYKNTFILRTAQCGASGIVFVNFPCREIRCPSSSQPFLVRDNIIELHNTSGTTHQPRDQAVACYLLSSAKGNYDNYFSPIVGDKCTTDGDFAVTEGYGPGNYFVFGNATFSRGDRPLSTGCGGGGNSPCGYMMHWLGQRGPEPDELGFIFRDMSFSNGATPNFFGEGGTPLPRTARVEWTYSVTVQRSDNRKAIEGAIVMDTDSQGKSANCTTNAAGKCSVGLVETYIDSKAGDATLVKHEANPHKITIKADGCEELSYLLVCRTAREERRTVQCHATDADKGLSSGSRLHTAHNRGAFYHDSFGTLSGSF